MTSPSWNMAGFRARNYVPKKPRIIPPPTAALVDCVHMPAVYPAGRPDEAINYHDVRRDETCDDCGYLLCACEDEYDYDQDKHCDDCGYLLCACEDEYDYDQDKHCDYCDERVDPGHDFEACRLAHERTSAEMQAKAEYDSLQGRAERAIQEVIKAWVEGTAPPLDIGPATLLKILDTWAQNNKAINYVHLTAHEAARAEAWLVGRMPDMCEKSIDQAMTAIVQNLQRFGAAPSEPTLAHFRKLIGRQPWE